MSKNLLRRELYRRYSKSDTICRVMTVTKGRETDDYEGVCYSSKIHLSQPKLLCRAVLWGHLVNQSLVKYMI